tara:strand:+ start:942 stop:1169 length:228 start_codon:yes stop_codon:yes gene_type:complete
VTTSTERLQVFLRGDANLLDWMPLTAKLDWALVTAPSNFAVIVLIAKALLSPLQEFSLRDSCSHKQTLWLMMKLT